MLDEEEGGAARAPQGRDVVEDVAAEGRVDARHGLVEEHDRRAGHQGAGDLEELPLAARERAGIVARLGGEAEGREQANRGFARCRLRRPRPSGRKDQRGEVLARLVARGEQHVVHDRHAGQHAGELEGANQPEIGDAVRRHAGNVAAGEPDGAGIRPAKAAEEVEHGRLAGAVRADQRGDRAALDVEARAGDGEQAVEGLHRATDFKDRAGGRGHGRTRISARLPRSPWGRSRLRSRRKNPTMMKRSEACCPAESAVSKRRVPSRSVQKRMPPRTTPP